MAEERSKVCRYCGITAPQGHWRPYTWIEKHEANCPKNPTEKPNGEVIINGVKQDN